MASCLPALGVAACVAAGALTSCSSLSDPIRFHARCYDSTEVVITTRMHEEAYCWIQGLHRPVCAIGDTVLVVHRDPTRPECAYLPPPWRP